MLKRKGFKPAALLLVLMLTVFGLSACAENTTGGKSSSAPGETPLSVSEEEGAGETEQNKMQTYDVSLTYVNEQYIIEGDESLEKLVTDVSGTVEAPEGAEGLPEACEKTLELLRAVPEGNSDLTTVISDRFKINSVKVDENGQAVVDLAAFTDDAGMDNYTEQFFIYQVTGSLVNSFEEVKSVTFTVDGQAVETLGGHLDASAAYTINDVDSFNAGSGSAGMTAEE